MSDPVNGINPGFVPISNFTGTLNGNSFTISNLYINATGDVGLFGKANGGSILQNLGLINPYVKGFKTGTNALHVGSLAGINQGTIISCYATGNIIGADGHIGGLVGRNGGTIANCYAIGNIAGTGSNTYTGGLVGVNDGTIRNGYAAGNVVGGGGADLGGLVGSNNTTIINCYATGNVTGTGAHSVGGLVGLGILSNIANCYATGEVTKTATLLIGGLVGDGTDATITNSFWDTETTTQTNGLGAGHSTSGEIGKTSAQLKALKWRRYPSRNPNCHY